AAGGHALCCPRSAGQAKYPPFCTGTVPSVRSVGGAQNGIFCRVGIFWRMRGEIQQRRTVWLLTANMKAVSGDRRHLAPTVSWGHARIEVLRVAQRHVNGRTPCAATSSAPPQGLGI